MNSIQLFHGDCLQEMKKIPDHSIDMTLCDLPYGTTACKWDVIIPFDKLWEQYERVVKDRGAIVLFGKQPFTSLLISSNIQLFKYELIWEKNRPTSGTMANKRPLSYHENILAFYKRQPIYNPQMILGKKNNNFYPYKRKSETQGTLNCTAPSLDGLKYPKSVQRFNKEHLKTVHPTQKPVALLEYLIKTYTNEGMTVLDNCMGSGSTGVACMNSNRNFIGIEKDYGYFIKGALRIYGARGK